MKITLLAIMTTILIGLSGIAFSQVLQCPAIYSVRPFVKNVMGVPFPQCYYLGKSALKSKKNHCKQIKKKLEKRFATRLKSKKLQNWRCYYNVQNKRMYAFTFETFVHSK